MMIFRKTKLERELVAHDLALICVMKDTSAITPSQVASSYARNLQLMLDECRDDVNFSSYEEELVRPC
jgi:hypothetical protein